MVVAAAAAVGLLMLTMVNVQKQVSSSRQMC
jgi:hypothetical protein